MSGGDDPAFDALRARQGRAATVRLRGAPAFTARLENLSADTLRFREGRRLRSVPVGAVTTGSGGEAGGAGLGLGLGALLLGGAAAEGTSADCHTCGVASAGALVAVPVLVVLGAMLGSAAAPSTRYVFTDRCR